MNTHEYKTRIYYADTDAAGIVYYANYLRFAEAARGELFCGLGFGREKFDNDFEKCKGFAVVECNTKYKAPAKLGEIITVKTDIVKVGGASMKVQQNVYRDEILLVKIELTMVCVDKDLKSTRIPVEIKEVFTA